MAITIIAASAAVSSCANSGHAGPGESAARYVGAAPDTCPYVSADQIAALTERDVTRVSLEQQPDAQGGRGCFYDLAVNPADRTPQYVEFSYFRGIGEQGFEHWSDAGEPVPGLGVKSIWGSSQLTVLTRKNDVVVIYMFTANGDLVQAQQIFHLAAPKLRAASAPAGFTSAQLSFLAWYNAGGAAWFGNVKAAMGKLDGDLTFDRAAVHHDALALQSAAAKALSDPSPIDTADYKAAITDAAGVALDALRHVPVDKQLLAASGRLAAFSTSMQHEFAAINSG
ncbi:MAG TPA: hypothetical protein VF834_12900 [Streptosporangiaceae bacterium]